MDNNTKEQIVKELRKYVDNIAGGSANKASKMLKGVSNAYLSQMLNGKWDAIGDDAWRNVQKQVANLESTRVNTKPSMMLYDLFYNAKMHANTFGVCSEAGSGKTYTAKAFAMTENVFLVCCNEYFNRRSFLNELLSSMGRDGGGYSADEMMTTVVAAIRRADKPVIILDEADKLADQVLYFFISLYNMLEGKCGIVMMATDHLEKRIMRGVHLNKRGYKEIYSRLGRKFITLPRINKKDVSMLSNTHGVTDELTITNIWNNSEGDLRRVMRLIHSIKQQEG